MKKKIVFVLCAVIILVTIVGIMSILNNAESDPASAGGNQSTEGPSSDSSPTPEPSEDLLLVDDDYIKASYVEVFESSDVTGVFYLRLRVENKSDKEIWVSLTDASVNGTSTTVMSGIPMTIAAGETSKSPFIVSYSNLDITELGQVSDITFKVSVADNKDMSTLEETGSVTIPFEA